MAKKFLSLRERYLTHPPQFWIFWMAQLHYVTMLTILKGRKSLKRSDFKMTLSKNPCFFLFFLSQEPGRYIILIFY